MQTPPSPDILPAFQAAQRATDPQGRLTLFMSALTRHFDALFSGQYDIRHPGTRAYCAKIVHAFVDAEKLGDGVTGFLDPQRLESPLHLQV